MRREILIGAVSLIIIAIVAIIVFLFFFGSPSAEITSATTDRNLYHSGDIMTITVSLSASGQMDNTTVRLEGIEDRRGKAHLTHHIPVNLSWGPNTFFYEYELPQCSSCAGILPGDYDILVTLMRDSEILDTANLTVMLEQ
jgi:hypothetical protein